MTSNNEIEQMFFGLIKIISDINNFGISESDDGYLDELVKLIKSHPERQVFFEEALLNIAKDFRLSCPIVIRSLMEVLKWERVRLGLIALMQASTSERYRHMLRSILVAYNDEGIWISRPQT